MEIITTTIYSKHDIFGCWSVKWENRGGNTGLIKVAAIITPYWEVLFKKLDEDGYIRFYVCSSIIDHITKPFSFNPSFSLLNNAEKDKALRFLNAFSEFCETEKIVIEKRVYSFWDAASIGGGNVFGFEKAQKKIKKELVLEGEDTVYKRLKDFLRAKHLI